MLTKLVRDVLDQDEQRPAGHLIVGHATCSSAKVWVQGSGRLPGAIVTLRDIPPDGAGEIVAQTHLSVRAIDDYTGVIDYWDLKPGTDYRVTAEFRPWPEAGGIGSDYGHAIATFRTAPLAGKSFSFILGSCNLSVVSINNLAVQAIQLLGFHAAEVSLARPISDRRQISEPDESWRARFGRWWMQNRWRRRLTGKAMRAILAAVFLGTGGKWPSQPIMRSPFLKLEALFHGLEVRFFEGKKQPYSGQRLVGSHSKASGVVAFAPAVEKGVWNDNPEFDDKAQGIMILVDVRREFQDEEDLLTATGKVVATIRRTDNVKSDYEDPAFMIHAGDQIYFDFPNVERKPLVENYREAYREAWFEDRYQRAFMARGRHYMTLDDHEIVDQFSRDRIDQEKKPKSDRCDFIYRTRAMDAYRDYVRNRNPEPAHNFAFSHGGAQFFVMDTRTERKRHSNSQMIDGGQMMAFERWLATYPTALKFVVSSVPFVAEVARPEPSANRQPAKDADNSVDDKWCAPAFRRQRDHIIDFVHDNHIDSLVFLVGDMHCAYHASMAIGGGRRWERRRIHELAGGPINQLDYGRREQFSGALRKETRANNLPYDIRLHQFHSGANAVMHIRVDEHKDAFEGRKLPEIRWHVIRTLTDPETQPDPDIGERLVFKDHAPISGRIVLRPSEKANVTGKTAS